MRYSIKVTCKVCTDCPCNVYLNMNTTIPSEMVAENLRNNFYCRGGGNTKIDPDDITITIVEMTE